MADEVETLKRELEALKLQLEKERKTNGVHSSTDSLNQLTERPLHRDESPKPKRRGGDAKASITAPKEPRTYVQHAVVGTRRGKWWLRDRQVLSRATPEEGEATLKVRETWVWSGRSVILDKIVRIQEEVEAQEDDEMEEEVVEEESEGVDITSRELVEDLVASPRDAATEAQTSEAAETSETATTPGEKAVVAVEEEALPQKSAKADDEVQRLY